MWNELIYGIGDIFEFIFNIFPILGNIPNVLFILVGFVLLYVWLRMQADFNRKARENGTLK